MTKQSSKAKIEKSLHSDINAYVSLKENLETLKESIKSQMTKLKVNNFEIDEAEAKITQVCRTEVDAEGFYKGLANGKKKNFIKMVNVVKAKAKKFVSEDYIEANSILTSAFDRLDVMKKSKTRKIFKKK